MSVSVVIPSTLERPVLKDCLDAVLASAGLLSPDAEVILVANCVPAGTTYTGRANPMLRVVHSDPPGVSRARNAGAAAARHETILFVDDDVVVPPIWCTEMFQALRAGPAAVAGPLRVFVRGPVTSYMDHVRPFDAAPLDGQAGGLIVTANAGYRRDLAPSGPPFDVERHPYAGEDTDLALRLRSAGLAVGWVAARDKPVHHVDEDVASVAGRCLRDGRSSARLYDQHRTPAAYQPCPWTSYATVLAGENPWYRRFGEIDSVGVRVVFATMSLVSVASLIAGYLHQTGELVGHPLVELDEQPLVDELSAIVARVIEVADVPAKTWHRLPMCFSPGASSPSIADRMPISEVAAAFGRHAAPSGAPPAPLLGELCRADRRWVTWLSDEGVRTARLWDELAPRAKRLTLEDLEAEARRVGLTLGSACATLDRADDDLRVRVPSPRRTRALAAGARL